MKKICPEHNRHIDYCLKCNIGKYVCAHQKRFDYCKSCGDAQKITIEQMIKHSKFSDKKKQLYNANDFIKKQFIKSLMQQSMQCHYCDCVMQLTNYSDTLCTIERLDNSIGHIESNCVLACRKCNYSRVGQRN